MLFNPGKIDKLAIVGLGISSYDWVMANYHSPVECQVWTINAGCGTFRHDVVFDMHTPTYLKNNSATRIDARRAWLKKHDRPIIMPRADPEYPTSQTYPLRRVIEESNSTYFTTGLAYLLALALVSGVRELALYGVDFSYDREKKTHDEPGRACCEYWVGRLIQNGCEVYLTTNTHFLDMWDRSSKQKIYGYDEPLKFERKDGRMTKFIGPDYVDNPTVSSPEQSEAREVAAVGKRNRRKMRRRLVHELRGPTLTGDGTGNDPGLRSGKATP